jgi:hypothetical protein
MLCVSNALLTADHEMLKLRQSAITGVEGYAQCQQELQDALKKLDLKTSECKVYQEQVLKLSDALRLQSVSAPVYEAQHQRLLKKILSLVLAGIALATLALLKTLLWRGECIVHQKFTTMVGVIHLGKVHSQKPAITRKLAVPRKSFKDGLAEITKDLPKA